MALVYGQMNEPPGARARVALTGLTVAEYFRDQEGQDVLLFIDNIFRFTQAGSEVSFLESNFLRNNLLSSCAAVNTGAICYTSTLFLFPFGGEFLPCISGVCIIGTYSICRGLPANPGH